MNPRAKNLVKVAIFGGLVFIFILSGTSFKLDPPMPTRVGDDPYAVSLEQLTEYAAQLEGQPIVITSKAFAVSVNGSSGDMRFNVTEDFCDISVQVLLRGWAPGGAQPAGTTIVNGTIVVFKGVCKILTDGIIEGTEVHVILQDNVYLVSISGLVAIGVMLFVYFRIDIKHLRFTAKKPGKDGARLKQEGA